MLGRTKIGIMEAPLGKPPPIDGMAILQRHQRGETKEFDLLVARIMDPNAQSAFLVSALRGLRGCAAMLNREFENLIGVVLRLDWPSREVAVTSEYQSFILNLVSAHTYYVPAVTRMIVKKFLPVVQSKSDEDFEAEVDEKLRAAHDRTFVTLHNMLSRIAQLVPMSPTIIMQMLSENFPYLTKLTYSHECYVKNMLMLLKYVPHLRPQILELIVDRIMKLDVRSPRDVIEESEEMTREEEEDRAMEEDTQDIFNLELGGSDSGFVGSESSPAADVKPMLHPEARRLDALMDLMFKFIAAQCHSNEELDWESCKKLFREVLGVFDKLIITTHASSHVQFIMFYMCSLKEQLCEGFLDYLWKKVQDPNTQAVYRQAAVAHMASLLARARFIPIRNVVVTLELIVGWVHRYIAETANTTSLADIVHHGSFYSVCQAVFYIIVFRHKELLESSKGTQFVESLRLQSIVLCRLNPLRVCLPLVVKTFASITRQHQLAYCDTVMEKNQRMVVSVAGRSDDTRLNPLDSFFPYDPYLLARSSRFIQELYREYEGNTADLIDADTEEDDDFPDVQSPSTTDIGMEELPASLKSPTSAGILADEATNNTPKDLLQYCTSPGFKNF